MQIVCVLLYLNNVVLEPSLNQDNFKLRWQVVPIVRNNIMLINHNSTIIWRESNTVNATEIEPTSPSTLIEKCFISSYLSGFSWWEALRGRLPATVRISRATRRRESGKIVREEANWIMHETDLHYHRRELRLRVHINSNGGERGVMRPFAPQPALW